MATRPQQRIYTASPSSRGRHSRLITILLPVTVSVSALVAVPAAQAATCGPSGNEIACENSLPGAPVDEWDINGAGDDSIQGFGTSMSIDAGQRIDFKIDTNAGAYSIDVYRLGYYGGNGARKIASVTPSAVLPQVQPPCVSDAATQNLDCGVWGVSASWTSPVTAVSGVYIAKLTRTDTGGASHITFIVRDDDGASDIVLQTSDTTWQAYNAYGGTNLYYGPQGRATKISYNRPFTTRGDSSGRDFLFSTEYPMIRFLERNGYDVSYISGLDTDRDANILRSHKTFMSIGHDEYWTGRQRANVEAARDAGVNLAFFSGNEVYWKTRYEPSIDGNATAGRTLVCYKETFDGRKTDPSTEWTGTWRDPRVTTAPNGGYPENALTGTMYQSNFSDLAMTVPAADGRMRLWRNTTVATLATGAVATLAPHTVGYESNEDIDNGFRPAGLVRLSTTTGAVPEYLRDFGTTVTPGTTTHNMTMYRAASGALVFSSGTIQWSWGLDTLHDGIVSPVDTRMQQATINLMADMGAQPATLMAGMVAAARTTDTTPPTVSVTAPAAGAVIANGTSVTMSGTATDVGGRVGAVEVSVDGGTRWHPATGRESWSYTFSMVGAGPINLLVRASDDSGNLSTTPTPRAVTATCPCSLFGATVPATPSVTDTSAVELGVRFSSDRDGWVQGVRFYKGSGNTGTHTGTLWSPTGVALATGTFTNETATGWQTLQFPAPIPVTKDTAYTASYFAPVGRYAAESDAFWYRGKFSPPLTTPGGLNPVGVFNSGPGYPQRSFGSTNYGVDVLFTDTDQTAPTVATQTPLAGASSVSPSTGLMAVFSEDVQPGSVSMTVSVEGGAAVAGSAAYNAGTRTVTFTPTTRPLASATRYVVAVRATDIPGNAMATPFTWTFRTMNPPATPEACPCGIWDDTAVPEIINVNEPQALDVGVRFTPTVDGTVTGMRFYKGPGNVGTHTGSLWSTTGTLLSQATFTGESSTGWQSVTFPTPVTVTAGSPYVVSYRAPNGNYSVTINQFSSAGISSGPLEVGVEGGVFTYAAAGTFPDRTSRSNYWVDVTFSPADQPPVVTGTTPGVDATNVSTRATVAATFGALIQSGSAAVGVTGPSGAVPGTTSFSSSTRTVTFTPAAALAEGIRYTVTVSGARSLSGRVMAPYTFGFTTAGLGACPCTLFASSAVPATVQTSETEALELGVRFSSAVDGFVTGVRFYKGPGNVGTHTGTLWSSAGQQLATVAFANESAQGWQSATFSTPVAVTANTVYVISYLAPVGRYSTNPGFFTETLTNGPLSTLLGANGVYLYGGGFPTQSFGSANYWVEPVFVQNLAPVVVNLAASRTATQSSTDFSAVASRAVDGDTNGVLAANSVTHTANQSQPWWQVDLGSANTVDSVTLWNRTDCCADRLADVYVFTSGISMSNRTLAQLVADPTVGVRRLAGLGGSPSVSVATGGAQARYVRVQIGGVNPLSLAEVQVFGSAGSGAATPGTVLPAGTTTCAVEGGGCAVPNGTTATVYFGATGAYAARSGVTGTLPCTTATFGDPVSGPAKSCFYLVTGAGPVFGTGLTGTYYTGRTLTGSVVLTRTEGVNFTWPASPGPGVAADDFSVRWTGTVAVPSSGIYNFQTISDDGVRVWVDGRLVVDNWTDHAPTTNTSASITLTGGQQYRITVDYYERAGSARVALSWKKPGDTAYTVIPVANLFPSGTPGINRAQGRIATQSSTSGTLSAALAVDGSTTTYQSTTSQSQPWWQVDLGSSRSINEIRLWNRVDCCQTRLSDVYVFVSATTMTGQTLAQLQADPAVRTYRLANLTGTNAAAVGTAGATGRYVRVQLGGVNPLHMAEVQVLAP